MRGLRLLHVLAGGAAGAAVGLVAGGAGAILGLRAVAAWVVGGVGLAALAWQLVPRRRGTFGSARQVPREWELTLGPAVLYSSWGALLGSGVATVVPYASYFLLLGAQVAAGPAAAALSGLLFGLTRQGIAVALASRGRGHQWIMATFDRASRPARAANLVLLLGGTAALVAAAAG